MVSFESEVLLARLRGRGTRLIVPTLWLTLAAFLLSFCLDRFKDQWADATVYSVCGVMALFGFLVPLLRYLSTWTDITTARVVSRSGLWGQNYRSVSLSAIERVEQSALVITLYVAGEEAMELRRLPKIRFVAQQISDLVAKSAPSIGLRSMF